MQKILQVWTRLPDEDGGRHAGDHLVPRTVELGQRDDLTQSGLVEPVQQLAALRTEEVDGPEFRVDTPVVRDLQRDTVIGGHD